MQKDNLKIFAVIVTYNRKELLPCCLSAVSNQSRKLDRIVIVDNASTDGTRELLHSSEWLSRPDVELLALSDNTGGAGGFAAGLKHATDAGADWVWMMDDDAIPNMDALENLINGTLDTDNIYGSTAVYEDKLSWPMLPHHGRSEDAIYTVRQLPGLVEVQFIPFLGIFVSKETVKQIGFPDVGFFLAADDVEYCMRARKSGARIILVGASRIFHPASERYRVCFPGRAFYSLKLPPWKRYYDVRNRIFIARKYYGMGLWYKTIPGSFLRLVATLWHESHRFEQIKAFLAGMTDGLLGREGKRHEIWGIK
ncbi:glycosyltransferase [Pseudomonas aestusnigri]|jgi:GT2 family glycosyltransferase|uniref:glycosyltransferase n=1 Tax=Halopseudomonas aestusnigri TaxID=857252 RepID=UPI001D18254F|nr:glycosyltransferase [Halopseudomonas aestusnigri]MCC4260149.1 glycosyltransferase [Halopseudomonas aestusnigri]|tara:strand:+ start:4922 stop:5851 length:930 start_codon:yes stop_codon:yes gene_type:complete